MAVVTGSDDVADRGVLPVFADEPVTARWPYSYFRGIAPTTHGPTSGSPATGMRLGVASCVRSPRLCVGPGPCFLHRTGSVAVPTATNKTIGCLCVLALNCQDTMEPRLSTRTHQLEGTARNAAAKATAATGKAATKVADTTTTQATRAFEAAQTLLSSGISDTINRLVAAAVDGPATIYDKAMDANYLDPLLRPTLGGSYHRLFDGGHTIAGAAKAAHHAAPDDTILQEAHGSVLGLLRDASTPRGLPLATWDKTTFDTVAAALNDKISIPKSWLYEANTYDMADLLGASVGVIGVVYGWNRADTETVAAVSAAGGSTGLMLLSGLTVGVVIHQATRNVDVETIARYLSGAVATIAAESRVKATRSLADAADVRSQYRRLVSATPTGRCSEDELPVPHVPDRLPMNHSCEPPAVAHYSSQMRERCYV